MKKEPNMLKQEVKLVAGLVPQPLAEKFALFCFYKGETRSKVIEDLLQRAIEAYPDIDMINEIARKLSWRIVLTRSKGKLNAQLGKLRVALKKKKLNSEYILRIISATKRQYETDREQTEIE
jgi:hypothetical protein